MKNVIFYSPHFGLNSLRFVRPLGKMKDVHLIGLGQDNEEYIRSQGNIFDEFCRLENASDPEQVEGAIGAILEDRPIHSLLNIQEERQLLIARMREKFDIPGLRPEVTLKFRDKAYMKQVLKEHDILCANYQRIDTEDEARSCAEKYGYPFVIKPLKGAGTVNTFIVYNSQEFEDYLQKLNLSKGNTAIIEEVIWGQEGSFDTVTLNGKILFSSITQYYPMLVDAMRNPWIQPIYTLNKDDIDHPDFAEICELGRKVIEIFELDTSLTHMEWFRRESDGKIYISEIAARPPGEPILGMHNYGHDLNLFEVWGELMINGKFDLNPIRKYHVGNVCFRAQGKGDYVREIRGLEEVHRKFGHLIVDESIASIGTEKNDSYLGESYIYCRGQDFEEIINALRYIIKTVRVYC